MFIPNVILNNKCWAFSALFRSFRFPEIYPIDFTTFNFATMYIHTRFLLSLLFFLR